MTEYMNILGLLEHFVRYSADNVGHAASIQQQTDISVTMTWHLHCLHGVSIAVKKPQRIEVKVLEPL